MIEFYKNHCRIEKYKNGNVNYWEIVPYKFLYDKLEPLFRVKSSETIKIKILAEYIKMDIRKYESK